MSAKMKLTEREARQAVVDQLTKANAEIARLRERIEKLEACVKAADALREKMRKVYQRPAFMGVFDVYRVHGFTYPKDDTDNWIREQDGYDLARAALGEVK